MQIHVLLSLIQRKEVLLPPLGWGKQFLVQIHMETVDLSGGCAERWFIPNVLGSLVFSAGVAKAEPCCAALLHVQAVLSGGMSRQEKWNRGTEHTLVLQNSGMQLDKQ